IPASANGYVAGQVQGRWFDDANQNGLQDTSEAAIAGATVYLDQNHNGTKEPGEPTAIADDGGNYKFTAVMPGINQVRYLAGPTGGPVAVEDSFDRASGTDLGADWTEVSGDLRIDAGRLRAPANTTAFAEYKPYTGHTQ